jgi:hypothetical protein
VTSPKPAPVPQPSLAQPPMGQSTLSDLKDYLEALIQAQQPASKGLLGTIVTLLAAIIPALDPDRNKGAERDLYLHNLFINRDVPGLDEFLNRDPAEPKHWIVIATWYKSLLVAA